MTAATGEPLLTLDTRRELENKVERFLLLARLLLAGTHQSCWQIAGASTALSSHYPEVREFDKGSMFSLMRRVVKLRPDHTASFEAFSQFLDTAAVERKGKLATSFDVALYRFNRAHETTDAFEAVVDLATALEAVLISDGNETDAISLRLRSRAAALLATTNDPAKAIFDDVGHLYGLRSKLVHGGSISEKDLQGLTKNVSTVPADRPSGVSFAFAVDRLRDLVRRAFLARLCLAAGPEPLWPFGKSIAVDALLADDTTREAWRARWRASLADLGAPEAAEAAEPGDDPLGAAETE
jgi:hypothetical protein